MAVPKRKVSKARRDKRRSSHWKLETPGIVTCPKCGARMKWRTIMGSRWCDKVERYDQCPSCGHERRVDMESSS